MSEFDALSRLAWATRRGGELPGSVEVSRGYEDASLVAKLWTETVTGRARHSLTLGPDIIVTGSSPVVSLSPDSDWESPSVLAAKRLRPLPEVEVTPMVRSGPRTSSRAIMTSQGVAIGDQVAAIISQSPPLGDRECQRCAGTGGGYQQCPCTLFSAGPAVIDIDYPPPVREPSPDPGCRTCSGTGRSLSACLYCGGSGTLCAPYDLTVDFGLIQGESQDVVIPGQPSAVAAEAGVSVTGRADYTAWTLSQAPLIDSLITRPDIRLTTPSGHPVMGLPRHSASVTVSGDQPWPEPEAIAERLISDFSMKVSTRFPADISEEEAELSGLVIAEGCHRGIRLVAKPLPDDQDELFKLIEHAEFAGLRVMLTVEFIATGESGVAVSLVDCGGEVVLAGQGWWTLSMAVQEALVVWG